MGREYVGMLSKLRRNLINNGRNCIRTESGVGRNLVGVELKLDRNLIGIGSEFG
jgi:hypothetical protein